MLIRCYALNSKYQRETHFVQCRTLATHTAKAMFDGFLSSLTTPTKVLRKEDMLTEHEVCDKTEILLADGASSMGVRHQGTSATKSVKGEEFLSRVAGES